MSSKHPLNDTLDSLVQEFESEAKVPMLSPRGLFFVFSRRLFYVL